MVTAWIDAVPLKALAVASVLLRGCSPAIAAAAAAAFLFPAANGRRRWKQAAWLVLIAGISLNSLLWACRPQHNPISIIARATTQEVQAAAQARATQTGQSRPQDLLVLGSNIRFEPLRQQELSSAVFLAGRQVPITRKMRRELCVLVWTLHLRNAGTRDVVSLNYIPEFQSAEGTVVSRTDGVAEWGEFEDGARCDLVSLGSVALRLAVGEERDLILRELVSKQAARKIRNGRLNLAGLYG